MELLYSLSLSTETTDDLSAPRGRSLIQLMCGTMRIIKSFTGSLATTHGPVQYVVSLLGMPGLDLGVNSQTRVPGMNDFLEPW